jgi:hypothetical protein
MGVVLAPLAKDVVVVTPDEPCIRAIAPNRF